MSRTKLISTDSNSMNLVTADEMILGVEDNGKMEISSIYWREQKNDKNQNKSVAII